MAENDAPVPDKNDFTEHYNTPLSAPEQDSFNGWMQDQSDKTGRNVGNELKDYDLQGWWQAHIGDTEDGPQLGQGHLTDEFKKPNHPTFSDESKYHGVAGNEGGHWEQMPGVVDEEHGPQYSFKTGATNLEHRTPEELQNYFNKVEEGNQLKLPEQMGALTPSHFANVRFNNPGAQYPGASSRLFGSTGTAVIGGGHLIANFPTPVHGAASNMYLLSQNYKGMTIDNALRKWSGGGRGAPAGYNPNQVIDEKLLDDPKFMTGFMQAVTRGEGPGQYPMDRQQWQQAFDWYQHGAVPGGEAALALTGRPGDQSAPAAQQAREAFAARTRGSVQPEGGRREGAATAVATHFIPTAIQGVVSSAMAGPKAMADVSSGELDPLSPEGIGAARNIALGTMGRPALKPGLGGTVVVPGAKEIAKTAAKPEREEEPKREPPPRLPDVSEMALSKRVPKRFKDMRT